jgi:hypothetical protein
MNMKITPAGLRGGGATHHCLMNRDSPLLRRRCRWSNEKTIERYCQESVYFLQRAAMCSYAAAAVDRLAVLAAATFK